MNKYTANIYEEGVQAYMLTKVGIAFQNQHPSAKEMPVRLLCTYTIHVFSNLEYIYKHADSLDHKICPAYGDQLQAMPSICHHTPIVKWLRLKSNLQHEIIYFL